MSQASFQKRMREKARQEKAAMKQQRRQERAAAAAEASDDDEPGESVPQEQVLAQLEKLHKQFADEQIDFEDFEERKQELMAQLNI